MKISVFAMELDAKAAMNRNSLKNKPLISSSTTNKLKQINKLIHTTIQLKPQNQDIAN
jgi:hypothetical protein